MQLSSVAQSAGRIDAAQRGTDRQAAYGWIDPPHAMRILRKPVLAQLNPVFASPRPKIYFSSKPTQGSVVL
jgi:hypothetical protein